MNEKKITRIYVILFVIVAVILFIVMGFIIEDISMTALLHLVTGSTCIALLVDKLNDVIHDKDNK